MKKVISLLLSLVMLLSITAGMNLSAYATTDNQELDDEITSIVASLNLDSRSDFDKILAIHDYVIDNVEYDYSGKNRFVYEAVFYGKAQCWGYTHFFHLMCEKANIDVETIYGSVLCYQQTVLSTQHAWNIVELNGKWYNVDVTWDDTGDSQTSNSHNYFLRCDALFYSEVLSDTHIKPDSIKTEAFMAAHPMTENCYNIKNCPNNPNPNNCKHEYVYITTVLPTCTENGFQLFRCSKCGEELYNSYHSKGHTYDDCEIISPTCTTPGTKSYTCTTCGEAVTEKLRLIRHTYDDGVVTKAPTCTSTGIKKYTCINCQAEKTEVIAKTRHRNDVVAHASTCYEEGYIKYTCKICGTIQTEPIAKSEHGYYTTTTNATTTKNGSIVTYCYMCGTVKSKTIIYYPKTITLSTTSYVYDGKVKKPTVIITDSNGEKLASSNYTVTYASGRKNVGKYTVKITFKGNYSGTVTKTFTIKPKATTLSSITAKSKGFTVKWKKQTVQTTGYEIQYATDSKFSKNSKTVTVSKNSTTAKTISKLSAKKKYYVRVRTYRIVNGKKYYSAWSKAKTVTTKR